MTTTAASSNETGKLDPAFQNESEIIGYVEPWVASPGQEVQVKVSSTAHEFTWSLLRIIQGLDLPEAPDVKYETIVTPQADTSTVQGSYKRAICGSYAVVESWKSLPRDTVQSVQFTCYVQPWLPEASHEQVLVSTLDAESCSGFAISIDLTGAISLYVGVGSFVDRHNTGIELRRWKWAELSLSISKNEVTIEVRHLERLVEIAPDQSRYSQELRGPASLCGTKPLSFAAGFFDEKTIATQHISSVFNGRLDSPHLKISHDGILFATWAVYDFALSMSSDHILDTSGNENHGSLANAPTRAVKGYNWDGSEPDWTKAKYGYGAIHFHDDDLDDAAWATDFTITIPENAPSGAYSVHVRAVDSPDEVFDHITFFVRPSGKGARPKAAIVLSTFTYLAYANEHMYDQARASRMTLSGGVEIRKDGLWRRMARRGDLGCSLYDVHNDGSGCVFSTAKRPILNIRPGYINWAFHRPREFSADQLMIGLLEEKLGRGGYDVLTDHDLHVYGDAALEGYQAILTGCHPEYPSLEVLNAYSSFARAGGSILYLGGNGFYWCTVLDSNRPHRVEVRKGDQGCRSIELPAGERNHSLNGAQGGLWRSRGRAPQMLFGVGSCACGSGPGVPFRFEDDIVQKSDSKWSWLFKDLQAETADGAGAGFIVGTEGFGGGASGDEIDRMDFKLGTPVNTVLLATSTGHSDSFGVFNEEMMFPMVDTVGTKCAKVRSDMVIYETSGGGSVFSVGSINWYSSLGWDKYENNVAKLTWNVLKEFIRRGEEKAKRK
ncbi:unnamed protein product [Clonostachys rosea]|uniref:N,N-dimethylformamidase beta subunit-like C-terminal domain-containing protein n=1 Tax=Bionectria ochroleuca TaxID=29856 RepID=A0ABY6UKX8_BIOOC|nr:unnamed protein product [Clonostachys rosea]